MVNGTTKWPTTRILIALVALCTAITGCMAVELPPDAPKDVWRTATNAEVRGANVGAFIGAGLIVVGIILIVTGVGPQITTELDAGLRGFDILGVSVGIEAPVGLILILVGAWVFHKTRVDVRVSKGSAENQHHSDDEPEI